MLKKYNKVDKWVWQTQKIWDRTYFKPYKTNQIHFNKQNVTFWILYNIFNILENLNLILLMNFGKIAIESGPWALED